MERNIWRNFVTMLRWVKQKTQFHHWIFSEQTKQGTQIFYPLSLLYQVLSICHQIISNFFDISSSGPCSAMKYSFTAGNLPTQNCVPLVLKRFLIRRLDWKNVWEKWHGSIQTQIHYALTYTYWYWRNVDLLCPCCHEDLFTWKIGRCGFKGHVANLQHHK